VGKVYQNKSCDICGLIGKVIESWGKKYCKKCWDKKPKKDGQGHSGMLKDSNIINQQVLNLYNDLRLVRTQKGNKLFSTLYLEHYPKSKGIVGRQCNYLIERAGEVLGIIGANSPPLNYKKFNAFFNGFTELNWLNNNVFRLVKRERNLGTKILRMFREQIKKDYETQYGDKLIGLVTFVEPPRSGSVYKADNWYFLGVTEGKRCFRRGSHGKWINKEWTTGTKKIIFARFINKVANKKLRQEVLNF
jgi:hypothetical protein